jgi:HPt (histidine-containing phosphotransfer) domain-containing protein
LKPSDKSSSPPPLIDFEQLNSACDNDPRLMKELMDLYFGQADQIMPNLQQAVKTGAIDDVDHLSHKLAGSSLACGMSGIVAPLRRMEIGAKAGHLNGAEASMAEAVEGLEKLRHAVRAHLQGLQNP